MKEILGIIGVFLILLGSIIEEKKILSGILAFVGFVLMLISLVMILRNPKS